MNREAFIRRLCELLAGLPQNEAAEAIQYYEDYFADAGEENEAKVIEELGSPERVAANIRADLGMPGTDSFRETGGYAAGGGYDGDSGYAENAGYAGSSARKDGGVYGTGYGNGKCDADSQGSAQNRGAGYDGGNWSSGAGYDRGRVYENPPKEKHTALWIVLAICTCYLWVPLLFVALILVLVAIIVVCSLSFAFGVTAFVIGVAAIALIGAAIVKMFVSPAGGLVLLGGGLIVAGLTIFCIWLVFMLFGKALPAFFRRLGSIGRKARRRRGGMR